MTSKIVAQLDSTNAQLSLSMDMDGNGNFDEMRTPDIVETIMDVQPVLPTLSTQLPTAIPTPSSQQAPRICGGTLGAVLLPTMVLAVAFVRKGNRGRPTRQ